MEYLKSWFRGFEQGIADLQPQQREVLFRACAVNCVHGGPFGLYRSLFEAAEGDLDRFFVKIDELEGVRGEIVCAGREYNLCFEACSCALHRAGGRLRGIFSSLGKRIPPFDPQEKGIRLAV